MLKIQKRKNLKGKNNPNYRHGNCAKKYFCQDCGLQLKGSHAYEHLRCRRCNYIYKKNSCLMEKENNPNYKHGKCNQQHHCKDCYCKISYQSAIYGSQRCHKCYHKFASGQNNPNYIHGKTTHNKCKICGENILYSSKCCRKCANKLHGQKFIGDKNPNWKGGKSFEPYPLGWNKTFKEQIRYRDKYTCQNPNCGISEIENGRKLDVHHINYDKKNIQPKNLISLCKRCHSKSNYNRKYWEEFYRKS